MCSLVLPVSHVGLRSLSRTFVQREFCSDCTASRVIHLKPLLVARCFLPYYFAEFVASRYYPCLFPSTHAPTLIYEPVLYCALGAEISDHLWIMRLLQVWRRACLQSHHAVHDYFYPIPWPARHTYSDLIMSWSHTDHKLVSA